MLYFKLNTGNLSAWWMQNPYFLGTDIYFMGVLFNFGFSVVGVFLLLLGGFVLLLLLLFFRVFCESLIGFYMLMIPEKIFWICFLLHSFSICLLCICCLLIFSFAVALGSGKEILEGHLFFVFDRRYTSIEEIRRRKQEREIVKSSDWKRKGK